MANKTIKFDTIRNLIISVLLLVLGGVLGYRYAREGSLPLGIKIPFIQNGSFVPYANEPSKLSYHIEGEKDSPEEINVNFDAFWEVWQYIEKDYLDQEKINPQDMVDGAIRGMTASLNDPYTMYLSKKDTERTGEDLAGSFYGVGIELGYVDGILAAIAPLEGSPAEKAGVEAGDLILHVKDDTKDIDEDTTGWSLTEAVEKIRGKKGVEVILTIYRPDDEGEPFDVSIKRGEIIVKSVEMDFVEHAGKRVAHIKLSRFGERTSMEWDGIVGTIIAQQRPVDGIVLDMRNNPGGYFDTSIEIASDFIKKGIVVSQKSKYGSQDFRSTGRARLADYPVVVLVNRGSASASEIVAGAIRDDLGAKLVGEKTFGKGTVQDRRIISNGGGLHLTIGRWMMPKGEWIHDEGIPVTVEVEQNRDTEEDEVLLRGIEEL